MKIKLKKGVVLAAFAVAGIAAVKADDIQGFQSNVQNLPNPPTQFETEEDDRLVTFGFQTGWASKYISEGVDAFGEGGIWEFNPEISIGSFTFSPWYGISDRINAAELKLIGSYHICLGDFTITPSYEHSFLYPGAEDGDTPAIGVTYEFDNGLTLGVDIQWAVDGGSWRGYYDIFVEKTWEITPDFNIAASVLYAFNDGYLGEEVGHGSNTIDYSLVFSYQLVPGCSFVCSANYSQALTVLRQAEVKNGGKFGDELWFGTYLHFEF